MHGTTVSTGTKPPSAWGLTLKWKTLIFSEYKKVPCTHVFLLPLLTGPLPPGADQADDRGRVRVVRGRRAGAGTHVRPTRGGGGRQDGGALQEVRRPAHRRGDGETFCEIILRILKISYPSSLLS